MRFVDVFAGGNLDSFAKLLLSWCDFEQLLPPSGINRALTVELSLDYK